MRKVLLFLICIACLLSVSAQEKNKKEYVISPTIEASGSFNLAIYSKTNKAEMTKKLLYSAGALFGIDCAQKHGTLLFQTGLLVSNNDYSYNSVAFKSICLDVPFIIGYAYHINDTYSLSFSAGYIIKNLVKYDIGYGWTGQTWSEPIEGRLIHGIYGAIGFAYRASPHFTLRIEPFFEYFFHGNNTQQFQGGFFAENMAAPIIGLRMGLKYNILKMKKL